jgi:hypothetical protein
MSGKSKLADSLNMGISLFNSIFHLAFLSRQFLLHQKWFTLGLSIIEIE